MKHGIRTIPSEVWTQGGEKERAKSRATNGDRLAEHKDLEQCHNERNVGGILQEHIVTEDLEFNTDPFTLEGTNAALK